MAPRKIFIYIFEKRYLVYCLTTLDRDSLYADSTVKLYKGYSYFSSVGAKGELCQRYIFSSYNTKIV